MLTSEQQIIEQLDEMTKRVHNLEVTLFISAMSQLQLETASADRCNGRLMAMFFKACTSYGAFKEHKKEDNVIGLILKNGDKL